MLWCQFLCFSSRLTCGLFKNHRTPCSVVASYRTCWCVPIEYHNCNDSHKSSREITGSYYALKGHPVSSQRGIILVESTQIRWFLRQSGGGGWSVRVVAQGWPRVSKLGLKGLSTITPMKQQSRQPDRRPVGQIKGYSHGIFTQKRELDNSSKPNWIKGQKAAHQRRISLVRKSYSLLLRVTIQMGEVEVDEDDDEPEPVEPITSPCDSVSVYWGLRVKHQKQFK